MPFFSNCSLSALTALPILGAIVILLAGPNPKLARTLAALFSLAALLFTIILALHFDRSSSALQFQERFNWVPTLHIEYRLAVDGLGILLLLLSAIVVPIGIAASWHIEDRAALYFALVLFLESCLFGCFTALNFIHWFTFWELSIIPAFFLIKLWGGPRRTAA
ncbi:MAG: NADH-quinone oxidoreductase subunit M, partial [Bryocella sp.]